VLNRVYKLKHIIRKSGIVNSQDLERLERCFVFGDRFRDQYQQKISVILNNSIDLPTDLLELIVSYCSENDEIEMKLNTLMKCLTIILNYWISNMTDKKLTIDFVTSTFKGDYRLSYIHLRDSKCVDLYKRFFMLLTGKDSLPQQHYLMNYSS